MKNIPALKLKSVSKSFGNVQVIKEVDLDILKNERHAIIGPNGAGKSTLFNLISSSFPVSSGKIYLDGKDVTNSQPYQINRMGLNRSFQVTNVFSQMTVFENLRCACLWSEGYGYSIRHLVGRGKRLREATEHLLELVGLQDRRDELAENLTYADQRTLEIGVTIAGNAEVIMLDEPTAGMSHHETYKIIELIRTVSRQKTLLIVEHDMGVVFGLADRISVLVYGEILMTGTPDEIRKNPEIRRVYLGEEVA